MIGQTISHYQILEKLGEGGMGVVYKAKDLKLERIVALKFLLPHLVKSDEEKQRFIREAQAASALDHANIGTIYEVEETEDGRMFIAMAYYEGETLAKRIDRGPLPLNDAVEVVVEIARGLARAHEAGIVHRDVKPANIMVTGRGEVKIVDFGLAKFAGAAKLTMSGMTMGTMGYLSPEQARGQEVDLRTDIWSLGVVLYEMISGGLPFKSDYPEAAVYSILNETPQPLTGLRTGIPMDLERIVNKAMAKQAGERYQHLDDMVVDLKGLGKIGKFDSTNKRTQSTSRGKRVLWSLSASFIVVAALVIGYINFESKPESDVGTASDVMNANERRSGVVSGSHRDTVLLTVRSDFADLDLRNQRPKPSDLVLLQQSEVQSILDDVLPRAISLLQPEYVVITSNDLERRMAEAGFLRKDYRSRDVDFMLDTVRSKFAIFMYVFRKTSSNKDSQYKLIVDIAHYSNGFIESYESRCEGSRNELLTCLEYEITRHLRGLTTREFKAAVLSVADDKIVFSFNNKYFIRSGALLTLIRKYDSTKRGLQTRLRDLKNEIDYLKKQGGREKRMADLKMQYGETNQDLARAKDTPGPISTESWSFGTVKVMEVFDITAVGAILEINEPWLTATPGDELMSAEHK